MNEHVLEKPITTEKPQSSEIHSGPGFRVRMNIERPSGSIVDRFREFKTPDISDLMNRLYTMAPAIKNLINDREIRGPACTVKVFPGDNLMLHKALDIAQPGDIIVVDAGASAMNAVVGDLISNKAKHRGISAMVIDGLIRDAPDIRECGFTIYARGVTPIGPLHRGPGEINYPISCGGIVVNPGDIICGDKNGVVVVRKDVADELLERLVSKKQRLQEYIDNVKKGIFSNEWVDKILGASDCEFHDCPVRPCEMK